jgi:zinc and cadmium transporter
MIIYILISSVLIMLASLIGSISIWKSLGGAIEKNLHYLVSFSAGVFLLISYGLAHESIEHLESYTTGGLWILAGIVLSIVIFKVLPEFHHHHDANHNDHTHSAIDSRRILVSDAIHNIGDGILLAASFSVSVTLGLTTALSVFIHEVIQEISEFFVLKQAGYSTKGALKANFIVSSTVLIGAIGGYFLLDRFEAFEAPLLGITAGSFFVIIFHDLIPHSIKDIVRGRHAVKHIVYFLLGLASMLVVSNLFSHLH